MRIISNLVSGPVLDADRFLHAEVHVHVNLKTEIKSHPFVHP